jgi:DASS family divalent anion:Na+ symporter
MDAESAGVGLLSLLEDRRGTMSKRGSALLPVELRDDGKIGIRRTASPVGDALRADRPPLGVDRLEALIRTVPFLSSLERLDMARLVGAMDEIDAPADSLLVAEGSPSDALYLLETGSVDVTIATDDGPRRLTRIDAPGYFGELGLLLATRTASIHASTEVRLWRLPRERFEHMVRERPQLGLAAAHAIAEQLDRRERELVGASLARVTSTVTIGGPPRRRTPLSSIVAAALGVGGPLALWWLPPPAGLGVTGWHVSLILLGAAVGWLLAPLPDFVIALIMAAMWGLVGVASPSLILGGFASSAWLVVVGALGIAAAMAGSGLLFRASLLLLKVFPATHVGQVVALLLGGIAATPLVPMPSARVPVAGGLVRELIQSVGYSPRSNGSAAFAFAALTGYGLFSSIFLTGFASNFFLLALLPASDRAGISWITWLGYAWPTGMLLLLGSLALIVGLFRPEQPMRDVREVVRRQEATLGPLSQRELVTLAAIVLLVVGLVAQPVLHVDGAWLALGSLALLFGGRVLDRDSYRRAIDWGFLTLFGILQGAGAVLHDAHVDDWLATVLTPMAHTIGNPALLLIVLSLLVVACRLVLPSIPARFLLAIAVMPIAAPLGISPWVAGFVIFVVSEPWLVANQGTLLRMMSVETDGQAFTDRQGVLLGVALTVAVLVAVTLSIPYWLALGLLKG